VPVENHPVTGAFLGWVGVDAIAGIEERLAEAAARAEPFRARVVDIGRFPDRGKARVLWVGLEDPQVSLAQLAEAVRASLGGEAAHDDRPFRPHITIARARRPVAVPAMGSPLDETLDVTAVTLFRSHLGGEHARYEALRRWPLGAEPVAIP
jgi:2'-5' RNA ligase